MRRLRWYEWITQNIYWFALSMGSAGLTPIILPLVVQGLVDPTLKNTFNGLQRAAGLMVAILVQPAAGILSDRSRSRWGRRRPFIAVGALLTALFVACIALARSFWALLGTVLLMQFATNIAHGALQGIIPDLVPEDQRGRASSIKSVLDLAPTVVVGLTIAPLMRAGGVPAAIGALCAIYIVSMVITVIGVREQQSLQVPKEGVGGPLLRTLGLLLGLVGGGLLAVLVGAAGGALAALLSWPLVGSGQARVVGVSAGGLIAMVGTVVAGVWAAVHLGTGDARRHAAFTWWVVNRLAFLAAVGSVLAFALFFLQDVLRLPDPVGAVGKLQAAAGVFTLMAALSSGFLADRFGARTLLVLAGLTAAAGMLFLLLARNTTMVLVAGCLIGTGTGVFFTTNWSLGTQLVPPEQAGRFLGISNVAGAGAGIVAAAIGGPLVDYLNRASAGLGYQVVFGIFAVCFVLSSAVLVWVRRPVAAGAASWSYQTR